jgi:hypothetical protein
MSDLGNLPGADYTNAKNFLHNFLLLLAKMVWVSINDRDWRYADS